MALNLKYNILDSTRRAMCTQLAAWKDDFYLAGGTGLALQLGHRIASVPEIGVFKLIALLRAAFRDYVDLFFILQQYPLHDLFALARKKYPGMDESLYLKAMLSYDDVDLSPIQYVEGYETGPEVIFKSLQRHVDRYLRGSATGKE